MKEDFETIQRIALEAIMKVENIKDVRDAARYASMNYNVYETALEAVRIAKIEFSI